MPADAASTTTLECWRASLQAPSPAHAGTNGGRAGLRGCKPAVIEYSSTTYDTIHNP
jgi:hypothetical protein